jgi:hypothetical protein
VAISGVVTIGDTEGRVVGHCSGPSPDGRCPIAGEAAAVPCAGHRVQTASQGRAGWEIRVSPAATECPLLTRRVWAKEPGHRWGPTTQTSA